VVAYCPRKNRGYVAGSTALVWIGHRDRSGLPVYLPGIG
jgi:hypothetical protein